VSIPLLGVAAALGSALSWALGAVLMDRVCRHFSPWALTLIKGVMGLLMMGAVVLVLGWVPLDRRTLLLLIGSGILGIGLGDTIYFLALRHLGAPTLVLLVVCGFTLVPIGSILFLGEQISAWRWVGIAAVMSGVGVVMWDRMEDTGAKTNWRGLMWGILFVLCMTASMIIAKQGLEQAPSLQATLIRMAAGTGAVMLLGTGTRSLARWVAPLKSPVLFFNLLMAVIVVTFGGFWFSLYAIKHLELSLAYALMGTEPLFALVVAWLLLRRRISGWSMLGTATAVAGIVILCMN